MSPSPTIPAIIESIAALSEEERSQLLEQLYKRRLIIPRSSETLQYTGVKSSESEKERESEKLDKEILDISNDPLVGLFSSDPHLATESEEIVQQEITMRSFKSS